MTMNLEPIGIIHTPFLKIADMPIQPTGAVGVCGHIDLRPDLAAGLRDLTGFSHIILLYQFHQASAMRLIVTPFLDPEPRGVFATRAPTRPNPIGLSIVKLMEIHGCRLDIQNIDVLDGTPLLDIKPYVPAFDRPEGEIRTGWCRRTADDLAQVRSDHRFGKDAG